MQDIAHTQIVKELVWGDYLSVPDSLADNIFDYILNKAMVSEWLFMLMLIITA